MKTTRLKPLWEVYFDLVMSTAMVDDRTEYGIRTGVRKVLMHPPLQRARWAPWKLWVYTGYTRAKMQQLHRDYIDTKNIELVLFRIRERLHKRAPFAVNLPFGHPSSETRLSDAASQRKHQLGECFTSFCLYFVPQPKQQWRVSALITWRISEVVRRFAADLCFLDTLFHAILDPIKMYSKLSEVWLAHGALWISALSAGIGEHMFPGLMKMMPKNRPFTRAWKRWERLAHVQSTTNGSIKYAPRRRATKALQWLKKHKMPSMFVAPLSAKRLHPGARESDFPSYTFGRSTRKERRRSREAVSRKGRKTT